MRDPKLEQAARQVDAILNPDDVRMTGFMLTVFPFYRDAERMEFNFVTNAEGNGPELLALNTMDTMKMLRLREWTQDQIDQCAPTHVTRRVLQFVVDKIDELMREGKIVGDN